MTRRRRLRLTEAANANAITALVAPHAAHGLTIAIVPGVAALVDAASRG